MLHQVIERETDGETKRQRPGENSNWSPMIGKKISFCSLWDEQRHGRRNSSPILTKKKISFCATLERERGIPGSEENDVPMLRKKIIFCGILETKRKKDRLFWGSSTKVASDDVHIGVVPLASYWIGSTIRIGEESRREPGDERENHEN